MPLIDDLKGVCASYGLGNDGNEFKIITQVFLYKFLNDKFAHEVKRIEPALATADKWEDELRKKIRDGVRIPSYAAWSQYREAEARTFSVHVVQPAERRQLRGYF